MNIVLQGSCAIWFNLHRNGEGNVNTRHAACPVLVGSKWGKLDVFILNDVTSGSLGIMWSSSHNTLLLIQT